MAGVRVPRAGSLRVLQRPLERMSGAQRDHFRADHIGYIFQMFILAWSRCSTAGCGLPMPMPR